MKRVVIPIARAFMHLRNNTPAVRLNGFHWPDNESPDDEAQAALILKLSAIICIIGVWGIWGIEQRINRQALAADAEHNHTAAPSDAKSLPIKP